RREIQILAQLALVQYHLGELEEGERLALEALDGLERTGDTIWQIQNLRLLHFCALGRSDLPLAEERVRQGLALAAGDWGSLRLEMCRYLFDVLILEERAQEARRTAAVALEAVPVEDPYARAVEAHIEATLATLDGRRAEAERRFEDALKILE